MCIHAVPRSYKNKTSKLRITRYEVHNETMLKCDIKKKNFKTSKLINRSTSDHLIYLDCSVHI